MEEDKIRKAIDDLIQYGYNDRDKFIKEMKERHRTEQQMFAGLILAWINEYAESPTDDRNKASVEVCQLLVELYHGLTGERKIKDKFPMI